MALQLDGMNRIIDTLIHAPTHGPQFLCVDPSIQARLLRHVLFQTPTGVSKLHDGKYEGSMTTSPHGMCTTDTRRDAYVYTVDRLK